MSIKDQQFRDQVDEIVHDEALSDNQKRVATGKALREAVTRLKEEGKTVAEITDLTGIRESRVRELTKSYAIHEQSSIWFPGIYSGREGDYAKIATHMNFDDLVKLVQKRAQEDGEWAIENNRVGNRPEFMRKMMAWVSDPTNIRQCVEHIHKEGLDHERTVDWVCRELATASKTVGGSRG